MTVIAANTPAVLDAATRLRPTGAGDDIGGSGPSSLGDSGADSAVGSFHRTLSTRISDIDRLVGRASEALAIYVANFDKAGG